MANTINSDETADALLPEIPDYDEDLDEPFVGPNNLKEWDETYDDEFKAETTAIIEGHDHPQASESSCGAVSGYTQLGAVPGSLMVQPQEGLPGHREFEPEDPTQGNTIEFASSEDDTRGLSEGLLDRELTNPDGSPHDMESDLLNEFQQVQ